MSQDSFADDAFALPYNAKEVGSDLAESLNALETGGPPPGAVPTGLTDLDGRTGGMQPGQLWVVASRPGIGKTNFALTVARNASLRGSLSTVVFSLGMTRREIQMRLLSCQAKIPLHLLTSDNDRLDEHDRDRIHSHVPTFETANLLVNTSANTTPRIAQETCRSIQQHQGLDLVIVDYIQLMQLFDRPENRQQEIAEISRSLKVLAKDLNVPVMALSQLNRGSEHRFDNLPQLSDMRDSGAIEDHGDVVLLLHREDAYTNDTNRLGEADIIMAKNRNSPLFTFTTAYQGHYSRFVDMVV